MSFKRFDPQDIVISAESITAPVWSNSVIEQTEFYTASAQVAGASGAYYNNIYQTASDDTTAAVQFSVAYGDIVGSGSLHFNLAVTGASPSKTIYGQYRSLVLGDEEGNFVFGSETGSHFYVISLDRARYKEKLLPGTFSLKLSGSGDGVLLNLTDNSQIANTTNFNDAGRVFEVVSGSLGNVYTGVNATGHSLASGSYGFFLPDVGIIMLNGKALDGTPAQGGINLGTIRTMNTEGSGSEKIFNAIDKGGSFKINSEETISSNFVFVRARNAEFNYSSNPSNVTGSGELRHDVMVNNPQSYATSVGLYNDNNDLLATAKLSRPLLKDFTKEALVRIKLDF
tara:strand:- start:91 stop:1113 length:1023 start_codon:yes stop_codon:yes gene_type:complete